MFETLTPWGIPPQIIGDFPQELRHAVLTDIRQHNDPHYTWFDYPYTNQKPTTPGLRHFSYYVDALYDAYTSWGAIPLTGEGSPVVSEFSSFLNEGDVTVSEALHIDDPMAVDNFRKNRLGIRLYCATEAPAIFIDIT